MTDVVGAASVSIEPDVSNVGVQLQAALAPALQSAVQTATTAGDAIATALSDAMKGIDFTKFATDAESNFQNVDTSAATAGTDIKSSIADAVSTASSEFSKVPPAAQSAMSDAASAVTASSDTIKQTVQDSVGPAAKQTVDEGVTEFGRFRSSAEQESTAAKDSVSNNVMSMGDTIKAVAIGNLIADGIKVGVSAGLDALQQLASFLPQLGGEFKSAFSTIRIDTGATGAEAANLQQTFRNIAATSPADMGQISTAVGVLNQRLDTTGKPLEDTAKGIIRLSSLTGTDLNSNLQAVTGAFNLFGVSADQQAGKVDELFRVFQATGIPISTLTSSMSSLGPITKQMGLSFEDTASLIGGLNKAGLDAGSIQMGLTKIMKKAADENVPAGQKLQQVLDGIKSGVIGQADAIDMFGPRGARLFDLIKSGTLDYKGLSTAIAQGGDTLEQAASDTRTWQGQLAILGNQLKLVLEPVATAVFTAITTGVTAIRPVIVAVAGTVYNYLVPGFQALVAAAMPVWDLFSRIRQGVADFLTVLASGGDIFDAIESFFYDVTGNADAAKGITDGLSSFADALGQVWDALQPVRDVVASTFTTIKDAVGGFISEHPDVILVGLAGAISAIVVPAVIALAGAIGTALVGAIGSLVSILASPVVVIGALAAAFYYAYTQIQPFHDAVDAVASFLKDVLMSALDGLKSLWEAIWPVLVSGAQEVAKVWDTSIGPALTGLWESLKPLIQWAIDHWQILAGVLLYIVNPVAAVATGIGILYAKSETFRNIVNAVIEAIKPFLAILIELAGGVISDVINLVKSLIDIIVGLFTLDWDKIKTGLGGIWEVIENLVGQVLSALGGLAGQLGSLLWEGLKALGPLIAKGIGLLWQYLQENWQTLLLDLGNLLTAVPRQLISWLGDLGSLLLGWLSSAWEYVTNNWQSILQIFLTALVAVPGLILIGLGKLGELLLGWLGSAWQYVSDNWQSILGTFMGFIMSLPGTILGWLGDLGKLLGGWLLAAFDWIVQNGVTLLGNLISFFIELPIKIVGWLGGLKDQLLSWLSSAWDWLVQNAPQILAAINGWLTSLPGTIIGWLSGLKDLLLGWLTAAWQWIVDNGPKILGAVLSWVESLPGMLVDKLSGFKDTLLGWMKTAFQWIVDNGPGIIQGVVDFFAGLPGKIFDAIKNGLTSAGGAVADLAKSLYNAVAGFVNEHLLNPIRTFKVSIVGQDFTPFEGIPNLPQLAGGGIVERPTLAWIGERGREAVLPLTNQRAMGQIADAAGISPMAARSQYGQYQQLQQSPQSIVVQVVVQVTNDTTRSQADEMGSVAGAAAARQLQAVASIRSA